MAEDTSTSEQDAVLDAWADAKEQRDAAVAAAWELPDADARREALAAAKSEWAATKAKLIKRQTAVDAAAKGS